jgi:predicted HAD superfamily Cof-like phosphohydrolase
MNNHLDIHDYIHWSLDDVANEKDRLSALQQKALSGDLDALKECMYYAYGAGISLESECNAGADL